MALAESIFTWGCAGLSSGWVSSSHDSPAKRFGSQGGFSTAPLSGSFSFTPTLQTASEIIEILSLVFFVSAVNFF